MPVSIFLVASHTSSDPWMSPHSPTSRCLKDKTLQLLELGEVSAVVSNRCRICAGNGNGTPEREGGKHYICF